MLQLQVPVEALDILKGMLIQVPISPHDDDYLELWLLKYYTNPVERQKLYDLLHQAEIIGYSHTCADWFVCLSFGYNVYEPMVCSDEGVAIYENFIKVSQLGKLFIHTLFTSYIKPTL